MRLIEDLEAGIGAETSLFRAQLLREDATRLKRLLALAGAAADLDTFRVAGRRLGWTQGDTRTAELQPALDALLEAVFWRERACDDVQAADDKVALAWRDLTRERVERLVGCLATPVPKPGAGERG